MRVCCWMRDSIFLIFSFPWLVIDSRLFLNNILFGMTLFTVKERIGQVSSLFERNYNVEGKKSKLM